MPILPKSLTLEEKKFLLAVERGDLATVKRLVSNKNFSYWRISLHPSKKTLIYTLCGVGKVLEQNDVYPDKMSNTSIRLIQVTITNSICYLLILLLHS